MVVPRARRAKDMAQIKDKIRKFASLDRINTPVSGALARIGNVLPGAARRTSLTARADLHALAEPTPNEITSPAALMAVRSQPPWGPISFLAAVVIPAIACFLYLALIAAPQYVSESRFVVRGSLEKLSIESVGQASVLSALNNSQEAHVVADYIRSPRIVMDLAASYDLATLFSRPRLDLIWRLGQDATSDQIAQYWQRMAQAEVDSTTGIVTVRIHAFTPQDALGLNQAVLRFSEALVSSFTSKVRAEQLKQAQVDSEAAHAELNALLATLELARGREATLDPLKTATDHADLVGKMRDARATLIAARATAAARLKTDSPTLILADENIRSLDAQIELLLKATTEQKPNAASDGDLLAAASVFDTLQARRELVTRRVSRAETALTQARLSAARQQVYLEVFMAPTLGQKEVHPRTFLMTLLVTLALAAIWGIAALYFETVRERTR